MKSKEKIGRASERKRLLRRIAKDTYCRLQASKIHGIGVFAIRDIPKGTNIFKGTLPQRWYTFYPDELASLDPEIRRMMHDYFITEKNGGLLVPKNALNGLDISFFLNHSKKSNVRTPDGGETFVTIRRVKKGEELTFSYTDYAGTRAAP